MLSQPSVFDTITIEIKYIPFSVDAEQHPFYLVCTELCKSAQFLAMEKQTQMWLVFSATAEAYV